MENLQHSETSELKSKTFTGKFAFNSPRLEKFAHLIASNTTSHEVGFSQVFDIDSRESRSLIKMASTTLVSHPTMAKRIRCLRKIYIDKLQSEILIHRIEGLKIIADRLIDPSTHSRDLPALFNTLSDHLGWKEENAKAESVDPITKLLGELKPNGISSRLLQ